MIALLKRCLARLFQEPEVDYANLGVEQTLRLVDRGDLRAIECLNQLAFAGKIENSDFEPVLRGCRLHGLAELEKLVLDRVKTKLSVGESYDGTPLKYLIQGWAELLMLYGGVDDKRAVIRAGVDNAYRGPFVLEILDEWRNDAEAIAAARDIAIERHVANSNFKGCDALISMIAASRLEEALPALLDCYRVGLKPAEAALISRGWQPEVADIRARLKLNSENLHEIIAHGTNAIPAILEVLGAPRSTEAAELLLPILSRIDGFRNVLFDRAEAPDFPPGLRIALSLCDSKQAADAIRRGLTVQTGRAFILAVQSLQDTGEWLANDQDQLSEVLFRCLPPPYFIFNWQPRKDDLARLVASIGPDSVNRLTPHLPPNAEKLIAFWNSITECPGIGTTTRERIAQEIEGSPIMQPILRDRPLTLWLHSSKQLMDTLDRCGSAAGLVQYALTLAKFGAAKTVIDLDTSPKSQKVELDSTGDFREAVTNLQDAIVRLGDRIAVDDLKVLSNLPDATLVCKSAAEWAIDDFNRQLDRGDSIMPNMDYESVFSKSAEPISLEAVRDLARGLLKARQDGA